MDVILLGGVLLVGGGALLVLGGAIYLLRELEREKDWSFIRSNQAWRAPGSWANRVDGPR